jgi:GTP-binding protein HflX
MQQVTTVRGVLYEIGARDKPELLALNKVDVAPPGWVAALRAAYPDAVPVSALTGGGVDELRQAIAQRLDQV